MKRNGFTLIELVVVIVILGILAAIAAPKFMDLQTDARISALNGLSGAIKSAANMSYAKSIIKGTDKLDKFCGVDNNANITTCPAGAKEVFTKYGIPAADVAGIVEALQNEESYDQKDDAGPCDAEANDWCVYTKDTANNILVFAPKSSAGLTKVEDYKVDSNHKVTATSENTSCALVYYAEPIATTKSTTFSVTVLKGGC